MDFLRHRVWYGNVSCVKEGVIAHSPLCTLTASLLCVPMCVTELPNCSHTRRCTFDWLFPFNWLLSLHKHIQQWGNCPGVRGWLSLSLLQEQKKLFQLEKIKKKESNQSSATTLPSTVARLDVQFFVWCHSQLPSTGRRTQGAMLSELMLFSFWQLLCEPILNAHSPHLSSCYINSSS